MFDAIRFHSTADAAGSTLAPDEQMLLNELELMPSHEQLASTRKVSVATVYRHLAEPQCLGYVNGDPAS